MKFQEDINFLKEVTEGNLSKESQVSVLFEILENVLDQGAVRARIVKYKLQKYVNSTNLCEKVYALNMIASDGKGVNTIPIESELDDVIEQAVDWIVDEIARRYVQNNIESKVEQSIVEKQEKYIDEVRLSVIKKQKGSENKKTKKKYEELVKLDSKTTSKNIMSLLRPDKFDEVVGQERAIKSLERMILELNNIRMEQYKALTEYSLIEDESSDNDFETPNTTVSIYQIKDVANTDYAFRGYDEVADNVDLADYDKVATIDLPDTDNILDMVFMYGNTDKSKFNEIKPMRSISVSDIIEYDGVMYYVDNFGFKEL